MRRLEEQADRPRFVYTVTFHVNSKRRVHSFWFLNLDTARRFYESVKQYPRVLDYRMYRTPISDSTEYDGKLEEGPILPAGI